MPKKTDQASAKRGTASALSCREHDDSPAVTAHVARMTHPLKPTLEALRQAILAADPAITEGIKWNSPQLLLPRLVCHHQQPQACAIRCSVFLRREGTL
jgi:hypothetical protein